MQDRYTGDVGDFGKYGLLRRLCGLRDEDAEPLKLGVVWYRPDPASVINDPLDDGKHTTYLSPKHEKQFKPCDPQLYERLRVIVKRRQRRVSVIRTSGLLGPGAQFYEDCVPGPDGIAHGEAGLVDRLRWAEDALGATAGCDLVFLDPDNGLAPASAPITSAKAPKYAYLEEVGKWSKRCQSLVIYHHLGRNRPHRDQIAGWLECLRDEFKSHDIFALRFRRGTSRAFFVLAAERHAHTLRKRAAALTAAPWSEHFDLHE